MKFNYIFIASTFILLCFAPAFAQLDRAFVATTGVDSGTCGATNAPCRSFNTALGRSNAGGEIIALDSGIYDTSTIFVDKSITLAAAPGVHAELYNSSVTSNRITINGSSTDTVILRNLFIVSKAGNTGGYGIAVYNVGTLQIENCVVDRFSAGISISLTNSAQVFIKETTVKNSSSEGIDFYTAAGLVKVSVEQCHFDHNGTGGSFPGVDVIQRARVTMRDSTASGNTGVGFLVAGGDLNLENCEASNNDDGGITAESSNGIFGTATVSNTIVTNNVNYGFRQLSSGVFNSYGNNVVRRNGTNTLGTITVVSGN
ncbi:MAG: right-handed parallel beta-helix repeat-containing protein [Actinomycetota bacterium]